MTLLLGMIGLLGDGKIEDDTMIQGKHARSPGNVRLWVFSWSVTVLNLSLFCCECPSDCLRFDFKAFSLDANRQRGRLSCRRVTVPEFPSLLTSYKQRQIRKWYHPGIWWCESFCCKNLLAPLK